MTGACSICDPIGDTEPQIRIEGFDDDAVVQNGVAKEGGTLASNAGPLLAEGQRIAV
jgi:hypothetical protein